jgi:hypothetical protein
MEKPKVKTASIQYDVALSFADEDRAFVEIVSMHLKRKRVRIYYDKDEKIFNWGADLNGHLDDVYRKNSEYCVMFISKFYKLKRWTNVERIFAQAKTFEDNRAYILPFRFDETKIEGVKESIIYLSRDEYDEKSLAKAIYDNIKKRKSRKRFATWWFQRFIFSKVGLFYLTFIVMILMALPFSYNLMPVGILTKIIYEKNKEAFPTICKDGTPSHHKGRGTCSRHGGIREYKDTVIYRKTLEESRKEAEDISWIE